MFGRDDNQSDNAKDTTGIMPPVVPDPSTTAGLNDNSTLPTTAPEPTTNGAPEIPASPSAVITPDPTSSSPSDSGSATDAADTELPTPMPNDDVQRNDDAVADADTSEVDDDLMNLKKQALQQLSPLVGQLDQTPDEKFRTTMMMIQASDDRLLVKAAFESAQAITDDKARAQALLDVINEINYFTQHKSE